MKHCPQCERGYVDETLNYCLEDGTPLSPEPGEPSTAIMTPVASGPTARGSTQPPRVDRSRGPSAPAALGSHRFRALAAAIAIAAAALGYYKFVWSSGPGPARRSSENLRTERLTGDGKVREAEISPDGKFVVYKRVDQDTESLWIKQVQTNSSVQAVKPGELADISNLAFTPDGNFVYFNARATARDPVPLYRVPTLGGSPVQVLSSASQMRFSPDGKQISFLRFDPATSEVAVFVANSDGSNERKLVALAGKQFFNSPAAWSPDGKLLAVSAGDDTLVPNPDEGVVLLNVTDGTMSKLGDAKWVTLNDLVWHPSGDSLLIVASDVENQPGQIWEIAYPSAETRRITNDLVGHEGISITADGAALVTMERQSRSAVYVSPNLDPHDAKQVTRFTSDMWGIAWAPDKRLVFSSDQSGFAEIWVMNPDGSDARQLTDDRVFKVVPVVSPDGQYVAYSSSSGGGQIVRIDMNGGAPTVVSRHVGADNPDISPDSKWILYSAWLDGSQRIFRVPIEGGEPQQMTDLFATEPRYSPDGRVFAAFVLDDRSQSYDHLAIFPSEGGRPLVYLEVPPGTNETRGPVWTPDGKGITVIDLEGEKQNLWLIPVDGGQAKRLTNFDVPGLARRDYSRDGRQIAITRAEGVANAIMIGGYR